jgi:sugar lactone lactonase YvrE
VVLIRLVQGARNRGPKLSLCFASVAALCAGLSPAGAQTAHFSGAQSIVAATGLSNPQGIALDASGNVYIADPGNNRVLKETLSSGSYVESTVASSGLNLPTGVAVDTSGNVFIADTANNRILKETPSGAGYTESVVQTTGLNYPLGLAVDPGDNLVITDSGNARVVKETYSAGSYTQSVVLSGPSWPDGVAIDASGDLYICAPYDARVIKLTPDGNAYTVTTNIDIGTIQPEGVAVDAAGNVYIADGNSNRVLKEAFTGGDYPYTQSVLESSGLSKPQAIAIDSSGSLYFNNPTAGVIYKLSQSVGNLATTAVGQPGAPLSMVFAFDAAGSIGTPAVVTQGIAKLDYADAGTGTCTTNGSSHSYAPGDSCTVDVTFTPKMPGARYGAAMLTSGAGGVIATGYLQGVGLGPQVNFPAGVQSSLTLPNTTGLYALAVDAAENLYITKAIVAYDPDNAVLKETWNGSGYTESVIATGLGYPTGIAVDGAGNVYIADQDNYTVYKETPYNGGYSQSIVDNTLGTVGGIAVDGSGNVYIARGGIGIEKETLSNGTYARSEIFYTFFASTIAVDVAGNLYFADGSDSKLLKETPSGNGYVESTIISGYDPFRFAVDSVGNVFFNNGAVIFKETPSGGGYVQSIAAVASLKENDDIAGLAVDQTGNLWYTDSGGDSRMASLWKIDVADPPSLSFASTASGATSSDSPQTVTLANAGNAALTFPIPASGNNPSITPGFTLNDNAASTCPVVGSGASTPGTLAAGASCALAISFVPTALGPVSGSLVLTDNAPNATQTIALQGTGQQGVPAITWAAPSAVSYGTALSSAQLNATAAVPGTFQYNPPAGTVLGAGTQILTASFTPHRQRRLCDCLGDNVIDRQPGDAGRDPGFLSYGRSCGSCGRVYGQCHIDRGQTHRYGDIL